MAADARQQAQSKREEDSVAEVDCSQPAAEAVTKDILEVKDEKHQLLDTAVNLPLEAACEAAVASRHSP